MLVDPDEIGEAGLLEGLSHQIIRLAQAHFAIARFNQLRGNENAPQAGATDIAHLLQVDDELRDP